MIRKLEYAVPPEFAGRTVLSFLRANGYSARVITGLKQNPHGIMLRNKKVTVQKTLKAGDTLVIYIRDKAGENVVPRDIPLDIPFEDRDVAVVNKPAGMATHPSQDNYDTSLANALAFHFQSRGEDVTVRSVNRLDKNTSGLVLIAKNQLAAAKLSAELKNGGVHKEYLALVEGVPDDCGTVDAPIARAPGSTIERMVSESGERAVTHYKRSCSRAGFRFCGSRSQRGAPIRSACICPISGTRWRATFCTAPSFRAVCSATRSTPRGCPSPTR